MSKNEYDNFIEHYDQYLKDECKLKNEYLIYGPLSSAYWNSNIKILFCNLEPYKFTRDANGQIVTFDVMEKEGWIINRTIKKTAEQVYYLMDSIEKKIYNSKTEIKIKNTTDVLKRIAYLNWRPTKNKTGTINADMKNIYSWVDTLKDYYEKQIELLSPDVIFITGGQKGKTIFNKIYPDSKIKQNNLSVIKLKKKEAIVCFTTHPSRISNIELKSNTRKIINFLKKI